MSEKRRAFVIHSAASCLSLGTVRSGHGVLKWQPELATLIDDLRSGRVDISASCLVRITANLKRKLLNLRALQQ